jgi:hypothetical protein
MRDDLLRELLLGEPRTTECLDEVLPGGLQALFARGDVGQRAVRALEVLDAIERRADEQLAEAGLSRELAIEGGGRLDQRRRILLGHARTLPQ